jgi:Trypsin-like peptidase domain
MRFLDNRQRHGRRGLGACSLALCLLHAPLTHGARDQCVPTEALSQLNQEISDILRSPSDDKRFVLPRDRAAFKSFERVGAVSIRDRFTHDKLVKSGSGTLINACYVLTSYHVVFPDFERDAFRYNPKRKVVFSYGVSEDGRRPFKRSMEGVPVDLGLFDPERPIFAFDQVLIRLKEPIVMETDAIELGDADVSKLSDASVWACGYPGDVDLAGGTPQSLYCDQCQVKGYHDVRGFETNCTMVSGTSGGGVFRLAKDARCEAGLMLKLVGAPNQSPEPEIFPKDHPRIRSFVTDFQRTLAVIKRIVDQDDLRHVVP